MRINRPLLHKAIDHTKESIASVIPDYRVDVDKDYITIGDNPMVQAFKFILNNPIINALAPFNPISILSDAMGQEFGDDIHFPSGKSITDIFDRIIPKLMEEEFTNMIGLFEDISQKITDMLSGKLSPSDTAQQLLADTLWTVIDAMAALFAAVVDIFGDLLVALQELCTGVWKIPHLTELWKDFSEGQELTILNMVSMVVAVIMNVYSLTKHGKLPFHGMSNLADGLKFADADIDMSQFLGLESPIEVRPIDDAPIYMVSHHLEGEKHDGVHINVQPTDSILADMMVNEEPTADNDTAKVHAKDQVFTNTDDTPYETSFLITGGAAMSATSTAGMTEDQKVRFAITKSFTIQILDCNLTYLCRRSWKYTKEKTAFST